ncbi:unnamed protein product [marine sediment metagenome]|uniref:Uncharacterized protein n=1 Tax=marine sediment metagenome TaxID=412755 RepID=X1E9K5_9ZZZZ
MKKKRKNKCYDILYCDPITAFKDPGCTHKDTVPYDMQIKKATQRSKERATAVKYICTNCGRISQWGRTSHHTAGGGFESSVIF